MKMLLPLIGAIALAAGSAVAQSPADRLKSLQEQYAKEEQAFYDALKKKVDAGQPVDMTGSPAKQYLPKALAIGKSARSGPTADKAYSWAVTLAYSSGDAAAMTEAFDGLLASNPNSAELKNSLMFVGYGIRDQEKALKLLSRIESKSSDREIKAEAIALRAAMFYDDYMGTGDIPRARSIYGRVIEMYPNTAAAKKAKAVLFAMDNLSVGMTAPDFTATDQDGVQFKLSDYRGKVVVVDFWGFW
jgi:tetratricopeptide (TPR) repeat protein